MTLSQFNSCLETFELDLQESNNAAGYSNALMNLINEFYSEQLKKSKEQLVSEMLDFVREVRSSK
jgi:hypothetical protein